LPAIKLYKHQEEAIKFAIEKNGNMALFHDLGLGKTRTAIEILKKLKESDPGLKMLVIAPLSLLEAAWHEDVKRFSEFNFYNLRDDKIDHPGMADILAINYEWILSEKNIKGLRLILSQKVNVICVLDESSRIKNSSAKTTKTLLKLAPLFKHRIVMTGTPAPNSEMEYWPQMQFISPGILGSSMTTFRSYFFHLQHRFNKKTMPISSVNWQDARKTFAQFDYAITDAKRNELMKIISPICHTAKKKDCLDLPEQIDENRIVEMDPEQAKQYKKMEKELVIQIQNEYISAPVALTKLMKLRQITSGFCYNAMGEAFEVLQQKEDKLKELVKFKL